MCEVGYILKNSAPRVCCLVKKEFYHPVALFIGDHGGKQVGSSRAKKKNIIIWLIKMEMNLGLWEDVFKRF